MNDVLLIGTGRMGRAYVAVLKALNKNIVAIGRSEEGTDAFTAETGIKAHAGGLSAYISAGNAVPAYAIIAVDPSQLYAVTKEAIAAGCKNILVEKPGALFKEELIELETQAKAKGTKVEIAYNRRHLASVLKAKEIIKEKGGVKSFTFEFNERTNVRSVIAQLGVEKQTEERWFIANSTHVIDTAFYLCGEPHELDGFSAAGPLWAPLPSIFSGAGITERGIPFSYHANWEVPGPWDVVIGVEGGNIMLRPLEMVAFERDGKIEPIEFDNEIDQKYKPGLYRQVEAFLRGTSNLPTLAHQITRFTWYERIWNGRLLSRKFCKGSDT